METVFQPLQSDQPDRVGRCDRDRVEAAAGDEVTKRAALFIPIGLLLLVVSIAAAQIGS